MLIKLVNSQHRSSHHAHNRKPKTTKKHLYITIQTFLLTYLHISFPSPPLRPPSTTTKTCQAPPHAYKLNQSFQLNMEPFSHLTNKDATRFSLPRSSSRKGEEKKMSNIPSVDNERDANFSPKGVDL
ncbi:hypothetical protein QVD17_15260 [Tagetes erecta]|uniref:Uncharacterized protein n=1 Tax=Tagetes erecta TaxID=13708 RepID=A0AAD8KNY5_TARER|nr:hypothetical protein QVD17_15260 [Tagetes erecta]